MSVYFQFPVGCGKTLSRLAVLRCLSGVHPLLLLGAFTAIWLKVCLGGS
jgi:hypothetical protein